jgi:hypothetical protein
VTNPEADNLLLQVHLEAIPWMLADLEPWVADENGGSKWWTTLVRHLLALARESFIHRAVGSRGA